MSQTHFSNIYSVSFSKPIISSSVSLIGDYFFPSSSTWIELILMAFDYCIINSYWNNKFIIYQQLHLKHWLKLNFIAFNPVLKHPFISIRWSSSTINPSCPVISVNLLSIPSTYFSSFILSFYFNKSFNWINLLLWYSCNVLNYWFLTSFNFFSNYKK